MRALAVVAVRASAAHADTAILARGTAILSAPAYVQFHWQLALDEKLSPAANRGEPAPIDAVLFLYVACRAPLRARR